MKLRAWRTVGISPCDDPPTMISIAPVAKMTGVFPWVLPLAEAEMIFGVEDIANIQKEPQTVFLTLTVANPNEP